jgi:hypothetical protein
MKLHLLLLLGLNMLFFRVLADRKNPLGSLKDAEFIIEKQKENELPETNRLFSKAPLPKQALPDRQNLTYGLADIKFSLNPLKQKIKLLKAKPELSRLYGHYIQLGYAYPYSPYLSLYLTNTSYQYSYGIHLKHSSLGRTQHLELYDNLARLYGKWTNAMVSLDLAFCLNVNKFPLYNGSPIRQHISDKAQVFYQLGLQTSLSNYVLKPAGLRYEVPISIAYLCNQHGDKEQQGHLQAKLSYPMRKNLFLETQLDFRLSQYQYQQTEAKKRQIESIKSSCTLLADALTLQVGLNLVHQNHTSALVGPWHLYPIIAINYQVFNWLGSYIGVKGDIYPNTWHSLIATNPWLQRQPNLAPTNQNFAFYGGIQGCITSQTTFHMGAIISNYQNLPFLLNSANDYRQFVVAYDSETRLINTFGELVINVPTYLKTSLKGNYYSYKPTEMARPWHKPKYEIELSSIYKLYDKLLCKGKLSWVGGIEALEPNKKTVIKLASSIDVGCKIDYLWNQRFCIFLDCQNLFHINQARYLYMPKQSPRLLVGITYNW